MPSKLTTERLKSVADKIKVKALCEKAGLPYTTIKSKMDRGNELTEEEGRKLTEALRPLYLR